MENAIAYQQQAVGELKASSSQDLGTSDTAKNAENKRKIETMRLDCQQEVEMLQHRQDLEQLVHANS